MGKWNDATAAQLGLLVGACGAVAAGSAERLERRLVDLAHGVHAGAVPQVAAEEALLQCYLFVGYPAALRALGVWRRVSGLEAEEVEAEGGEADHWLEQGAATCRTVYGGQYGRLRSNIAALHPAMERWMVMEGYGKVLSRPGLPLWMRECCVVAVLAWQDAAPQLYSHLRGSLNAGAERAAMEQVVGQLMDELPPQRRQVLAHEWERVATRRG